MKPQIHALVTILIVVAIANPVRADTFSVVASFEGYSNGNAPAGLTPGGALGSACGTYTVDTTTAAPGGGSASMEAVMGAGCAASFLSVAPRSAFSFYAKINNYPSSGLMLIGAITSKSDDPNHGSGDDVKIAVDSAGSPGVNFNTGLGATGVGGFTGCPACHVSLGIWYQYSITISDDNPDGTSPYGYADCRDVNPCQVDFSICGGDFTSCDTTSLSISCQHNICGLGSPCNTGFDSNCEFDGCLCDFSFRGSNVGASVTVWYDRITAVGGKLTASGSSNYDFGLVIIPNTDAGLAIPAFGKDIGYTSVVGQFLFGLVLAAAVFMVTAGAYAGLTNRAPGSTWAGTIAGTGMAVYNVLAGIWQSWVGVILIVVTAAIITAFVKGWLFGGFGKPSGGGEGG